MTADGEVGMTGKSGFGGVVGWAMICGAGQGITETAGLMLHFKQVFSKGDGNGLCSVRGTNLLQDGVDV